MNRLSVDRQCQIIKVLCEGNSIRSTARITGASINTVVKLLKEVGLSVMHPINQALRTGVIRLF